MSLLDVQQTFLLALRQHQAGNLSEAEPLYRQVLEQQGDHPQALHYLGVLMHQRGHAAEAVDLIRGSIHSNPNDAAAHTNLGNALRAVGNLADAVAVHHRAIELNGEYVQAYFNLGSALRDAGQIEQAIAAYRQAIVLKPDWPQPHNNLANALKDTRQLDAAIAEYQQAIALDARFAEAHNNLGIALKDAGELDGSMAAFSRALEIRADFPQAHSNLIYTMHFQPGTDAQMLARAHADWYHRHAEHLKEDLPFANDRNPERQLRIGYVSADFKEHPVGRFLLPLLAHHDKRNYHVTAYSDVPQADAITHQLQSHVECWRDIRPLSDAQVSALIRRDQIDILVDLTMHMGRNRLLVFARKPAPVQVTYLAYCSTTGLATIDYRLSDPYLDPPGFDETVYSERTIRLPRTYWCYQPSIEDLAVAHLPALANGHVTFGCLNNFCKVSLETITTWTSILRDVPTAHLILHASEGIHRQRLLQRLERDGIAGDRVRFVRRIAAADYFHLYDQIDIALDPFPYGGGTTTCDALWMGVPVITLAGDTAVGRGGVSVLSNIGLPELIAHSSREYIELATMLAPDLQRLGRLRGEVRSMMRASGLMNTPQFAGDIESAYRRMWREWCAKRSLEGV